VCTKLGGAYAVKLTGDGGGTWTIDFKTASVQKGVTKRADLTLEISGDDFVRMMHGALDVIASLKSGRIKIHGDGKKIGNLAVLFAPMSS
jgi:putative sterol carrier protein